MSHAEFGPDLFKTVAVPCIRNRETDTQTHTHTQTDRVSCMYIILTSLMMTEKPGGVVVLHSRQ